MSQSSVSVLVKEAAAVLESAAVRDLTTLTDGEIAELVVDSHAVMVLATAVHTAAVARLDRTRAYEADGARSAAAWVSWRCRIPSDRAAATARCARALRSMPGAEAAFLAGRLTSDHVRVLARAQALAPETYAEHEAHLVGLATELRFRPFETAIRYWCHRAAPDDVEGEARRRYDDRHAHCSETFRGMMAVDAMLEPIGGQIVGRELRRLEQGLFDADWAEARERLGDAATGADLRRSASQRRADALVEMARRSATKEPGAREARVLLSVIVGETTLARICELSNGTVVTPGEVLPVLHQADVERIVFDGPSRVIDVGERQRLFVGATRRAVELRDRTCLHPSCDVPAERCQVDHIVPFPEGGPTTQANGRCLCPHHHRLRHRTESSPGP